MLPVVAIVLLKMLPLSSLASNDVTDVATFPTSYTQWPFTSSKPLKRLGLL
jgi:hypothetical protein